MKEFAELPQMVHFLLNSSLHTGECKFLCEVSNLYY